MLKYLYNKIRELLNHTVGIVSDYIPQYKTSGAACFDLESAQTHTFQKNELFVLGTGIRAEIPDGYCLLVFSRSSLGLKKVIIPNSVGVIDADYRGEIKVPLLYLGDDNLTIESGQRIAQAMLLKVTKAKLIKKDILSSTIRNTGGFGSTDIK